MNEMKLTCVTAVWNAIAAGNRDKLIRCVKTVGALKTGHEHLLMDGASTDGTVELLRKLEKEIPGLKVMSAKDTGIYNALNKGLATATGEWFYVLGSDDYICEPEILDELLLKTASGRDEVLIAPVEYDSNENYAFHQIGDLKNVMRWIYAYCHQGLLVKTDLARMIGGFDEEYRFCADGDMMLKLHKRNSHFHYTFRAFANFSSGGANEKFREEVARETNLILSRHFMLTDDEKKVLAKTRAMPIRIARRFIFSRDLALRISARWAFAERMWNWLFLNVRPFRMVCMLGLAMVFLGLVIFGYGLILLFVGREAPGGWHRDALICFTGGVQLVSVALLGKYANWICAR